VARILSPLEWADDDEEAQLDALIFRQDHGGDFELFQETTDLQMEQDDIQIQAGDRALTEASSQAFEEFAAPDLASIGQAQDHDLNVEKLHADPSTLTPEDRDIIGGSIGSEPRRRPSLNGQGPGDLRDEPMRPFEGEDLSGLSIDDIQNEIVTIAQQDRGDQNSGRFQSLLDEQRKRAQEGPAPVADAVGAVLGFPNRVIEAEEQGVGALSGTALFQELSSVGQWILTGDPGPFGSSEGRKHLREETALMEDMIPKEVLDQLDRTIGFSFAQNPIGRYQAIRDVVAAFEEYQRTSGAELLAATPEAQPMDFTEFRAGVVPPVPGPELDDIERILSQNAARFSERFQEITDKYGIAAAEIFGNIVGDPLNLFGFGLLGKVPLVGKLLGPMEMAYIRATDKIFNAVGRGLARAVGKTGRTIVEAEASKAAQEVELFASRRAAMFSDEPGAVDELVALATGPDDLGDEFATIQRVFDADYYDTLPMMLKDQTPAKAADIVNSQARRMVEAEIEAGAVGAPDHILREMGLIKALMDKMPLTDTRRVRTGPIMGGLRAGRNVIDALHNEIYLPYAQSTLVFLNYLPANYAETALMSALTGSQPGLMAARQFDALRVVLGPEAPVIGGARDFVGLQARSLAQKGEGRPWTRRWQQIREWGDENVDAALRRNNYSDQLKKNINADPVLKERFDSVRAEVIQDLPPELRPYADDIADMAGVYAVKEPSALPQIADFYGTPEIKQKVTTGLRSKYGDLPPEVLHLLDDFGAGQINSTQVLRTRSQDALETAAVNEAHADTKILGNYVDEIEATIRGIADSGDTARMPAMADTWLSASFYAERASVKVGAISNLRREALNTNLQGGPLTAAIRELDAAEMESYRKIGEVVDRIDRVGEEFGLVELTTGIKGGYAKRSNDIVRRTREYHEQHVVPLQRLAQDTNSRAIRKQRWEEARALRHPNYARAQREMDELLAEMFPQTVGDSPLNAKNLESVQDFLGPQQQMLDDMLTELDQMAVVKSGEASTDVLRENLTDLATRLSDQPGLQDAAKKAIKQTTDRYQATFIQYPGNNLDAIMRYVNPFWIYQSRREVRILKAGLQHPGLVRLYGDYFANSDQGYISVGDTGFQFDPTRNSLFSVINSSRRRGTLVDPGALARGDFKNVVSSDRFPDRWGEPFGTFDRAEEMLSAFGIYPGAMVKLPVSIYRAIWQGIRGDKGDDMLRAFEGGAFIPSLIENAINLAEIAGVDTGGLRTFLRNPFNEMHLQLELTDQMDRGEPADLQEARKAVGGRQIVHQQSGATRFRSMEGRERARKQDEILAKNRGWTVAQVIANRQSADYIPPDPHESALIQDAIGRDVKRQAARGPQELRAPRLRAISEAVDAKRVEQDELLTTWSGDFSDIESQLAQYGTIYSEKFGAATLNDIMGRFWQEWNKIDAKYVDDIPQTEQEWAAAQDMYGITPKKPTAFGAVYKEFRAIQPDNPEYQMKFGETDWDAFFTAQETALADMSPGDRQQMEAITQLRDAYAAIPFRTALREAAQIRRKYYDEPRFFRIGDDDEIAPYSEADQQKLATVERQVNLFILDAQSATFDVTGEDGIVMNVHVGETRRQVLVPEVGFVNGQLTAMTPDGPLDANATYFAEQIYLDEARRGRIPGGLFANLAEVEASVSQLRFTRASEGYLRRNDRMTPRQEFLAAHRSNPNERFPGSNRSLYDVVYEGRSVSFEGGSEQGLPGDLRSEALIE
jgi:hypothetical protein